MTTLRYTTAAILILCCAAPSGAQPPRDVQRAAPAGTASISGTITTDEAQPKPLRRTRVTLRGGPLTQPKTAITRDDGSFAFDALPAGTYTLRAAKDAYVPMGYGAARSQRPSAPIALRDGEAKRLTIRLPRGGVITGTVTGVDGQPVADVRVSAMVYRYNSFAGERRLTQVGTNPTLGLLPGTSATTDDRGVYRLFGLPPDDYVISATVRMLGPTGELRVLSEAEIRRALADVRSGQHVAPATQPARTPDAAPAPARSATFSPIYFPGTAVASQATVVTVGKAEERTGVDIALQYVAAARVEGAVVWNRTGPAPSVMLTSAAPGATSGSQSRSASDGTFSFAGVPPGPYVVTARVTVQPGGPGTPTVSMSASTEINVDGEDIANIVLTPQPGLTLSGRLVFEGAQPPALDFSKLKFGLPLALASGSTVTAPPAPKFDASGGFVIDGMPPGTFRITNAVQGMRSPIGPWWLKSVAIEGRELLDRPYDLRQSSSNVIITFSDRASSLAGTVRDNGGNPVPGLFVVAFSADKAAWFANSRRVSGVTTDKDGRYSIRNLPAGEYFLAATYDLEPNEWFDAEVLPRLMAGAARLSIREYEEVGRDLTVR
jgi:protocatechuate 3,4-dioxygenase beta subunit